MNAKGSGRAGTRTRKFPGWLLPTCLAGQSAFSSRNAVRHAVRRFGLPWDDGMAERTGTRSRGNVSARAIHTLPQVLQRLASMLLFHKGLLPRKGIPPEQREHRPRVRKEGCRSFLAKGTGSLFQTCSDVFYFLVSK